MKVADDTIIRLDNVSPATVLPARVPLTMVYAAQRVDGEVVEHDGRGLLLAIFICMVCWGVLGFFLLN